jgi:hypothetical protein
MKKKIMEWAMSIYAREVCFLMPLPPPLSGSCLSLLNKGAISSHSLTMRAKRKHQPYNTHHGNKKAKRDPLGDMHIGIHVCN